jgi:hypothetical protein
LSRETLPNEPQRCATAVLGLFFLSEGVRRIGGTRRETLIRHFTNFGDV